MNAPIKKICFLLTSLEAGGTEKYLLRFLEHYKNDIDATIICKSGKLGTLENNFRLTNAKILPIKMGYLNFFVWFKVYNIFYKNQFETVADLTSNFGGVSMMLASFARIKKRVSFYRQSSNHFKENNLKLLYNAIVKYLVFKCATNILSNSIYAFEFFFPNSYKNDVRFEVIYNGIDSSKFLKVNQSKDEIRKELKIPQDKFIIGHVGRFNIAKNHQTILNVAEILTSRNDSFEFLFCGKGTDSEKFKKLIKEKDLLNKVHLLGYRNDVSKIFKAIDFFVFPSVSEGQPNSFIEAMLYGLPFCASNINTIKESVPKFMYNNLVDPFDINGVVRIIENHRKKPDVLSFEKAKNWAILKYNSEVQFGKFFKKL